MLLCHALGASGGCPESRRSRSRNVGIAGPGDGGLEGSCGTALLTDERFERIRTDTGGKSNGRA